MTWTLSDGRRSKLREFVLQGAALFDEKLKNKCFKIVCADDSVVEVRFFSNDFKHLTGIESDLGDSAFYANCISRTLDINNIRTEQKYNWSTLNNKATRITHIHELLYTDASKTLLLEALTTHTLLFPYAICNDESNLCVGFVGPVNRARSLRKASNSHNAREEKEIVAIFRKEQEEQSYQTCIYRKLDQESES